ncbi:hypothetical protein BDV39DRAFT_186468 [Aspergillus sergii]|uniref:Transmembrane protein n=1 Tax=Aspergillus sergii TaxID=1034303 RepID=A0A5N6WJY0_9EURO|nr:hypothetical protein BDV39DRAFT_186468 [Aspergillus sergii]
MALCTVDYKIICFNQTGYFGREGGNCWILSVSIFLFPFFLFLGFPSGLRTGR